MVLENDFPGDPRVENEVEILHNHGFEITVASSTRKNLNTSDNWKFGEIKRKKLSKFIYKSSVGALKFNFYFNFWKNFVTEILSQQKFDAIHVHDLTLAKPMIEIGKKHKIPVVIDTHENHPYLLDESPHTKSFLGKLLCNINQWKQYESIQLKSASFVVSVADEMKHRYESLGVNKNKICVYQNVVNFSSFSPEVKSDFSERGNAHLIYVGGVNQHRGIDTIINAISDLDENGINIELTIVGDGSYLSDLKKLSADKNLENRIHFSGWVNFKEVPKALIKGDIALIPHKKSVQTDCSSPNKLFQYMACGLPVLSSNCNSIVKIIEEEKIGLHYTWGDSHSLKKSIKKFALLNSSEKRELGINGIKAIENKYNITSQGKELVEMYNELLNAKN